MTSLSSSSSSQLMGASCRNLPGEGTQVHPRAPLLQILKVAGAREEVFTLKEVMHYLGQYIMMKQLYDKQRQHIVHCQDDPLGELLEVGSFSVKNPSPVYEMLKRNLFILNNSDGAKNLSVGKDSNDSPIEDPGQVSSVSISSGQALNAGSTSTGAVQSCSQRRPRDPDEDSSDDLPRSACKRPKLDVTLEEWDLSGLPWWFLGNLRSNYARRSNGSTDIHTNQDEDTAIVSDTTDDLWFLNEAESEQVSVEMKEAVLEQGSDAESPHEEEETAKDCKDDKKDAWQCSECRKFNTPLQRYCMRCWALRKDWYKDCPRLVHSISDPDIPVCSSRPEREEDEEDDGIDMPDCLRTVSDPVVLPSHHVSRNIPPSSASSSKGKAPSQLHHHLQESSDGDSQDMLDMETECQPKAMLEPCKLCRVRPRNGNIIHGRTAHLITCFPCARKLHRFHAPCPGCGQVIQKVIKTFIA